MQAGGEINKAKLCRPCFWGDLPERALRMRSLWNLCARGESYTDESKQTHVHWEVVWDAFRELRETGHPLFGDDERWEAAELMAWITSEMNRPDSYWALPDDEADDGQ